MQKAILGYGKTAGGKYRPLLVDDTGHLVIELGAAAQQSATPNQMSGTSGTMQVEPDRWIEEIFAWNGSGSSSTVKVGSSAGGDDIVNAHVVEPGQGELLPIRKRVAATVHFTASTPVALNLYTRTFQRA
jgi:hypothetical protein